VRETCIIGLCLLLSNCQKQNLLLTASPFCVTAVITAVCCLLFQLVNFHMNSATLSSQTWSTSCRIIIVRYSHCAYCIELGPQVRKDFRLSRELSFVVTRLNQRRLPWLRAISYVLGSVVLREVSPIEKFQQNHVLIVSHSIRQDTCHISKVYRKYKRKSWNLEKCSLLVCDAVSLLLEPTFRWNISAQSLG
jgi:hypothetical protein